MPHRFRTLAFRFWLASTLNEMARSNAPPRELRRARPIAARFGRLIRSPVQDFALPDNGNSKIASNSKCLSIGAKFHKGVVGRAVARIENSSVPIVEAFSPHPSY